MVYLFLAEGFEEIEAFAPVDLLRRANVKITTVGIGGKWVTGSHGISVEADITDAQFESLDLTDTEMVILPGGMPGTKNLDASAAVHSALDFAIQNGRYIAAICAAPMILGKRGDLSGKEAVCYPGFEKYLCDARISNKKVVRDGKIITAQGMGAALDFALSIVLALCGESLSEELRAAVIAD